MFIEDKQLINILLSDVMIDLLTFYRHSVKKMKNHNILFIHLCTNRVNTIEEYMYVIRRVG